MRPRSRLPKSRAWKTLSISTSSSWERPRRAEAARVDTTQWWSLAQRNIRGGQHVWMILSWSRDPTINFSRCSEFLSNSYSRIRLWSRVLLHVFFVLMAESASSMFLVYASTATLYLAGTLYCIVKPGYCQIKITPIKLRLASTFPTVEAGDISQLLWVHEAQGVYELGIRSWGIQAIGRYLPICWPSHSFDVLPSILCRNCFQIWSCHHNSLFTSCYMPLTLFCSCGQVQMAVSSVRLLLPVSASNYSFQVSNLHSNEQGGRSPYRLLRGRN